MQPDARSRWEAIRPGDSLPERVHRPGMAELFLYSAVIWNAHRIHYDQDYATRVEGYPGVVITGPLQGDWLAQTVTEWLDGTGTLISLAFQHRKAAYLGETLRTGGEVLTKDAATGEVSLRLHVRNEAGEAITPGQARVRFALP